MLHLQAAQRSTARHKSRHKGDCKKNSGCSGARALRSRKHRRRLLREPNPCLPLPLPVAVHPCGLHGRGLGHTCALPRLLRGRLEPV